MANKLNIFIVILLFTTTLLNAQTITGHVYDEKNLPLEGAVVYFDGTTISVSTNAQGYFSIKGNKAAPAALVINFIGFIPVQISNPYTGKQLAVVLVPDAIVMDEAVVVGQTIFSRKEMLRAFRTQFLGASRAGSSCKIENEDDIRLRFDSHSNTLYAEAVRPLRITNKHLKYTLTFDLIASEIRYKTKSLSPSYIAGSFFGGTVFFTDVSKNGNANKQRRATYFGSPMHFIKSLANNDLAAQKFSIFRKKSLVDPTKLFKVSDTLGIKKLTYIDSDATNGSSGRAVSFGTYDPKRHEIMYYNKVQSFFIYDSGTFYANTNGIYWPLQELTFGGDMGDRRIGDMLPSDYKLED